MRSAAIHFPSNILCSESPRVSFHPKILQPLKTSPAFFKRDMQTFAASTYEIRMTLIFAGVCRREAKRRSRNNRWKCSFHIFPRSGPWPLVPLPRFANSLSLYKHSLFVIEMPFSRRLFPVSWLLSSVTLPEHYATLPVVIIEGNGRQMIFHGAASE